MTNRLPPKLAALALVLGACGDNFPPQADAPEIEIDMGDGVAGDDGSVTVGESASAAFTLRLTRAPTAPVTMSVTSSDETAGLPSTSELTFTPENFSLPQTIEITAIDDDIAGGDRPFSIHLGQLSSDDPGYDGIPGRSLSFVSRDDDVAGFAFSDRSGMTTESNGLGGFKLALTSEPVADVVIELTSDDTSEGTVDPTITFTAADWNLPQTVTVTGADDDLDDGTRHYHIHVAAISDDPVYAALEPMEVSMLNADNDIAGVAVSPMSGPTTEAGGTATFDVVLEAEPLADVVVTLGSSDPGEGSLAQTTLTFTAANWSVVQTATVIGADEFVDDGDADYQINATVSSADALYAGTAVAPIAAANTDDDTAGIKVSPIAGLPTESGGTATFELSLDSEPTAEVVLSLAGDDASEGSLSATEVTFTAADWDQPRAITVTGADDDLDDGDQVFNVTATAASADPKYAALDPAEAALLNADNDTAGIAVTALNGPTTEAGGAATFSMVLGSEPTADVTFTFSSSDPTEGAAGEPITFTAANWDIAQTVTVTGADDFVDDGDIAYAVDVAITSGDAQYAAMGISPVAASNTDDDIAGVAMGPISGSTSEAGAPATFDVVLESQPTAPVVVTLSSSNTAEGTIAGSLTFTPENWNVAQSAIVTGADDFIDDGDISYDINASVASDDLVYAGVLVTPLAASNLDDDTAGVAVSAISGNTTEDGGTATFTVALDTEPLFGVSVSIIVDDATEGSLDKTELTFTALDWDLPQTVTVTGLSDSEADGNVTYDLTFAVTSADTNYNATAVTPLAVINEDVPVCLPDFSFDDGTTNGFLPVDGSHSLSATTAAAAAGSKGLELTNGGGGYDGAFATFASQQPDYVSVQMRADGGLGDRNFFVLGDDNTGASNEGILFVFASGNEWVIESSTGTLTRLSGVDATQYTNLEFELDWTARTMNVYANGSLFLAAFAFHDPSITGVTQLHLFNLGPATAQYDEITIGCGI